jgi:hypothetical protein
MTSGINHTNWFFHGAIDDIDGEFGKGYAKQHPELIAGYMQAAATVHAGEWINDRLSEIGVHLKYLGTGDAATTMGAIEFLASHLGEKLSEAASKIADAVDPVQVAQAHIARMMDEGSVGR